MTDFPELMGFLRNLAGSLVRTGGPAPCITPMNTCRQSASGIPRDPGRGFALVTPFEIWAGDPAQKLAAGL